MRLQIHHPQMTLCILFHAQVNRCIRMGFPKEFLQAGIHCPHFFHRIERMIRCTALSDLCRTHHFIYCIAQSSVRLSGIIPVRLRQDLMSCLFNCPVSFDIGIDDPVQICLISADLLQIAFAVIAGKCDRRHKCRMAQQIITHVGLICHIQL